MDRSTKTAVSPARAGMDLYKDQAVSPARAGMDPWPSRQTPTRRCFPRTRGDGPRDSLALHLPGMSFPPHARGWTCIGGQQFNDIEVSPARAGMDLGVSRDSGGASRFPRTRGDGPLSSGTMSWTAKFPPHARGWTPSCRASVRGWIHLSFPRTRGDGPSDPAMTVDGKRVSPARAGMDRTASRFIATTACFPRTRGDGPVSGASSSMTSRFPPHARGWTRAFPGLGRCFSFPPHARGWTRPDRPCRRRADRFPRTRGDGPQRASSVRWHSRVFSPARAGMDRRLSRQASGRLRFPRTRGDGPVSEYLLNRFALFPPHARGWTLTVRVVETAPRQDVSPARAGMDPSTSFM